MRNRTVAVRYAKAVYELGAAAGTLDDAMQGLSNLCLAIQNNPGMEKILFNPLVSPSEKSKLVARVTSNKLIEKLVDLLSRRKKLYLIRDIHSHLQALIDAARGVHRALIKTAAPLTDEQRRDVEKNLAKAIGGSVVGKFTVAKELIGGIWVQTGGKVLDATLKGRIDDFRYMLVHSSN